MSELLQHDKIILTTGSPIRYKLFKSLGLAFDVIPSHCDEAAIKRELKNATPIELGYTLARTKALAVSQQYPEAAVIAADQLCICDRGILDKPMVHKTAITHLKWLRGKSHQQLACLCIAKNNSIIWTHHESAWLHMRKLSNATIEAYLAKEQPYRSCGSYQYESMGKWLFDWVDGSEDTILGLPLPSLINALLKFGICQFKN